MMMAMPAGGAATHGGDDDDEGKVKVKVIARVTVTMIKMRTGMIAADSSKERDDGDGVGGGGIAATGERRSCHEARCRSLVFPARKGKARLNYQKKKCVR